jgi:hypothetical protein
MPHICAKPLKAEWKQTVNEWRLMHPYATLSRQEFFAPLLAKTIEKLNPNAIIAGYRATGTFRGMLRLFTTKD